MEKNNSFLDLLKDLLYEAFNGEFNAFQTYFAELIRELEANMRKRNGENLLHFWKEIEKVVSYFPYQPVFEWKKQNEDLIKKEDHCAYQILRIPLEKEPNLLALTQIAFNIAQMRVRHPEKNIMKINLNCVDDFILRQID